MSLTMKFQTVLALVMITNPLNAWATKPLALVWNGPGICPVGCAAAAAKVAQMAGYRTQYINTKNLSKTPFDKASLWLQPGGKSSIAAKAMGPQFMEKVRAFVANGGGYVGFCAGMFIATKEIAHRNEAGFGVAPGETELYLKDDPPAKFITVKIGDRQRHVYYLGGPLIRFTEAERTANEVKELAHFDDGSVAAINSKYGLGRVSLAGFHPEASWTWALARGKWDRDGSDRYFALEMIKLAEPARN